MFMLCYENYHRKRVDFRQWNDIVNQINQVTVVFRVIGQSANFFHRRAIREATFNSTQLPPVDYHHHPSITWAGKNRKENLVIKFWDEINIGQ